jgi:hypothetical protein
LLQSGFKRELFLKRNGDFFEKELSTMNTLCNNKDIDF